MANNPIQSSGTISMRDIEIEVGYAGGSTINLNTAKGLVKTSSTPNPVTGNNSITGQPKNGLHISDWYGYNHNAKVVMNFGTGFDSPGNQQLIIQPDGDILVGGSSSNYQGVQEGSMCRLNNDGSRDTAFNSGGVAFDGSVIGMALQSDGKIIVGGSFDNYNAVSHNSLLRLNATGTIDSAYNSTWGAGFIGDVYKIGLQSDGKAVLVGSFTSFRGTVFRGGFLRLNADGSEDTTFSTAIGSGASPNVFNFNPFSVAIQPTDQKILVGGTFTLYKSTTRNRLMRFSSAGVDDSAFYANLGTGFNDKVATIAVQSDGKILVGGNFATLNGVTRNCLVRLNSDGTLDTAFSTNVAGGFTGEDLNYNNVECVTIQPDGKILVSGDFVLFKGVTRNGLVRLNSDGTEDTAFYTKLGTGFNNVVYKTVVKADTTIIATGLFTTVNGVTKGRICQLDSDGTILA